MNCQVVRNRDQQDINPDKRKHSASDAGIAVLLETVTPSNRSRISDFIDTIHIENSFCEIARLSHDIFNVYATIRAALCNVI